MARKPDDTGGVISRGTELRLRPRRGARAAQGRRAAAGPVQRQGDPQRQRADLGRHGAQVQRGVRPVRLPAARRSSRPTAWPRRRCSCRPPRSDEPPEDRHVDRDAAEHRHGSSRCPTTRPSAVAQAGAGKVGVAEWATIVDAETATELPDGQIGEIWISGQNMGTGYWDKPEETVATFQNILKSRTNPSHAEGATDDATWVRTGDYGAYHDGELYITGRVKDLVIIDGRNHYPQDLEYSAQESTQGAAHRIRRGVLGAGQPASRRGVRERARRSEARPRRHLRAVGHRRRAGPRRAQAGAGADRRRHPRRDRGAPRRHRARRAADARPARSRAPPAARSAAAPAAPAYLDGSLRSGKVANAFPDETD